MLPIPGQESADVSTWLDTTNMAWFSKSAYSDCVSHN